MTAEHDPAKLFPEGFYDRLTRLAAHEHAGLRDQAQAELTRHYRRYAELAAAEKPQVKRANLLVRKGIMFGSLITAAGVVEKNPAIVTIGAGTLLTSFGIHAIENSNGPQVQEDDLRVIAIQELMIRSFSEEPEAES